MFLSQTRSTVLFQSCFPPSPAPSTHTPLCSPSWAQVGLGPREGGISQKHHTEMFVLLCMRRRAWKMPSWLSRERGIGYLCVLFKAADQTVSLAVADKVEFSFRWPLEMWSVSQWVLPAFWIPFGRGPHSSTSPSISWLSSVTFCGVHLFHIKTKYCWGL